MTQRAKDRAVICVLGMHRSGTSCLAGCLQELGLEMGRVVEEAPYNRKGNRENLAIRALNDDILSHSGGSWDRPPDTIVWNGSHVERARNITKSFDRSSNWGFKDPRTCLTLPFWLDCVSGLEFVGTYRHPWAVAQSLRNRDGISSEHAVNLWMSYNNPILRRYQTSWFPLVSFDLHPKEYEVVVRKIALYLGLERGRHTLSFLQSSLTNYSGEDAPALPREATQLLDSLQQAAADSLARLEAAIG